MPDTKGPTVLKRLQFKAADHARIYVWKAPPEVRSVLDEMSLQTTVATAPGCKKSDTFAVFFVENCAAIKEAAPLAAAKFAGDGVLWFAYPKKSSKRYKGTDISRDNGWQPLGDVGFEPVRQIAIDSDWSALRFRRVEFIKSLKRDASRAMTGEGKKRSTAAATHARGGEEDTKKTKKSKTAK
jgi:hypothetical protein